MKVIGDGVVTISLSQVSQSPVGCSHAASTENIRTYLFACNFLNFKHVFPNYIMGNEHYQIPEYPSNALKLLISLTKV